MQSPEGTARRRSAALTQRGDDVALIFLNSNAGHAIELRHQPLLERTVKRKSWLTAAGIAALSLSATLSTASLADEPAEKAGSEDVSIPFANTGGIRDWHADSDRGLWIQDVHGKWYYATVMSPCIGLNFAQRIGFDTRPMGSFDKFSSIVVPREGRCSVQTLRPSGAPPRKNAKSS
jgi:hypothetical protein